MQFSLTKYFLENKNNVNQYCLSFMRERFQSVYHSNSFYGPKSSKFTGLCIPIYASMIHLDLDFEMVKFLIRTEPEYKYPSILFDEVVKTGSLRIVKYLYENVFYNKLVKEFLLYTFIRIEDEERNIRVIKYLREKLNSLLNGINYDYVRININNE